MPPKKHRPQYATAGQPIVIDPIQVWSLELRHEELKQKPNRQKRDRHRTEKVIDPERDHRWKRGSK